MRESLLAPSLPGILSCVFIGARLTLVRVPARRDSRSHPATYRTPRPVPLLTYYGGANEVAESEYCGDFDIWSFVRGYIHGASYVDERLMMKRIGADGCTTLLSPRPYYYVLDRLYNP